MKSIISKPKQTRELLNHILDQPELPAIIQSLDAGILTKLIRHVGLEDSAEIISLSTTHQLKGVLDEDLWHSESPGRDETFDAGRFSLWLEIMMENGSAFAARKVMELDEDLLTLGLCRLVLVLDNHDPGPYSGDDREPMDDTPGKKFADSLNQEFGRYRVVAKNESSWDTVCALLAELNELDYDMLIRLLGRCCRISGERMEDHSECYHVHTAAETLEEDVSSERQERRESKGFATPVSAAVFLRQARSMPLKEIMTEKKNDPVTRAYFKEAERKTESAIADNTREKGDKESFNLKRVRFIETLQKAEVLPEPEQKMLSYQGGEPWDHPLPLARAVYFINMTDPDLYSRLQTEISYLSNTLITGCPFRGRTFQPKEAAEAAFSVCNLGSEIFLKTEEESEDNQPIHSLTLLLKEYHLVKLFQVGWKILFDDVVLHTAKAVLAFINHLKDETQEPERLLEFTHMLKELRLYIFSDRPWSFNEQLDYLQIFMEGGTTMALAELLQEYPTLSEYICKKEGYRSSPFIWSQAQIRAIRRFLNDEL